MTLIHNSPATSATSQVPTIGLTSAVLEQYSFFQALRQIERDRRSQPRIGYAQRPADEPVRVAQPAELTFAASTLTSESRVTGSTQAAPTKPPVEIQQRFLGLLGPGGPLPLHYTETVRDRSRHQGDEALQAFLDIFHHRLGTLFYRAWSDAQSIVQHDRPDEDKFARFLGSLAGAHVRQAPESLQSLDDVKRYYAGQFTGAHRHAEGLAAVLSGILQVKTQVKSFAFRKLTLARSERSTLSSQRNVRPARQTNRLGQSAQLGSTVPDCTSMIAVDIGPVSYSQFQQFLPSGHHRQTLTRVLREYAGPAIDARVTIELATAQVPGITLGRAGQLGRTCWLNRQRATSNATDYTFEVSGIDDQRRPLPGQAERVQA